MGGFWSEKSAKPNAKRVMVAAHMDEVGFMITHITENGMINLQILVALLMIFGKDKGSK